MRYTFAQFKAEYPDDDACLEAVFQSRYSELAACPGCGVEKAKFYRVKKRKCYACAHCGHQLHPLSSTIFRKSETSLWNWFYAIYLFSTSKNGVSAKELERHLGVTYKTAWRMCKQIRQLMADEGSDQLGGTDKTVEVDETYIGGRRHGDRTGPDKKEVVFGAVERNGHVKATHLRGGGGRIVLPKLREHVALSATIYSDQARMYRQLKRLGYEHDSVNHGKREFGRGITHTNTIEGFWSQMKRSIDGTYHAVSPKYLQLYVNEFAFRYNYRDSAIGPVLLAKVSKPSLLAS